MRGHKRTLSKLDGEEPRRDAARPQPPPEGRPGHGEGWELTLQAQDSPAILHLVSTGTGGFAAESFCRVLCSAQSVSVPSVMEKELQERRRAWLELRLGVHVDQGNMGTLPGFQKPEAPSLSCKAGPFPTALSSPSALSTKGAAVRTLLHMTFLYVEDATDRIAALCKPAHIPSHWLRCHLSLLAVLHPLKKSFLHGRGTVFALHTN